MLEVNHRICISIIIGALFTAPAISLADTNTPSLSSTTFLEKTNDGDIELILQTRINKLILGDTFGILKSSITYIGIQNLFFILDFPISINLAKKSATGWYIQEDRKFSLRPSLGFNESFNITANDITSFIGKDKILFRDDDIYIEAHTIFEIFNIRYTTDTNSLTLNIFPEEPLPIQKKLARKNKTKPRKRNLSTTLPIKKSPYKFWTTPFMDIQSRYTDTSLGYTSKSYSILAASDLAYMTSTYYLQGNDKDSLRYLRIKLSRDSLNDDLLGPLKATHFSFGEINPNVGGGIGSANQEIGARISNKPFGRNIRLQQTDFIGDTQPEWDVELYRNNIFIDSQTVGNDGRYEFFNQSILSGKNVFKLKFYGPEGQQHEKIEEINVEKGSTTSGKTYYDVSLSKQKSSIFEFRNNINTIPRNDRRFNISLFRDINKFISLQTTYSRYKFVDGSTHNFIKPAIRIFALNTLLFSNFTKDINGGYSAFYSLSKSLGKQVLSYNRKKQSRNFFTESNGTLSSAKDSQTLALSGPIVKTKIIKINYDVNASRKNIEDTQIQDTYNANFSANAFKFTFTNNLSYTETNELNTKSNKSLFGNSNLNHSIYKFNLRAGTNYVLTPEKRIKDIKLQKITKLFGNISWLIIKNLRAQYGYNYTPQSKLGSHSLKFNFRTKKFSLIANYTRNTNNTYTVYAGINFSLSYDKNTSALQVNSDRIANTGAISAKIFIDDNNNGIHDSDETVINGARLNLEQARKTGETNDNGEIFLPGLPINALTDVQLDKESLKDPFLTPKKPGYSFLPRPGVTEVINISLVTSGEIEGTVYIENKDGSTRASGYAPLTLTNIQTREKQQIFSAYDGFYLFSSIPPGKYLVEVERSFLTNKKYSARKPMPRVITIYATGNIDMGNDFTLYLKK